MKMSIVTTPNTKGQIVIPQTMRQSLSITPQTLLNITLSGNGIHVYPISDVIHTLNQDTSYAHILTKTNGAWGAQTKVESKRNQQKKRQEINHAQNRKKTAW